MRLSNICLKSATSSRPSHQKPPLPKRTVPDYQPSRMQGSLVCIHYEPLIRFSFFSFLLGAKAKACFTSSLRYLRIDVSIATDWWCAMGCIGKPRRRHRNQHDNGFRVKRQRTAFHERPLVAKAETSVTSFLHYQPVKSGPDRPPLSVSPSLRRLGPWWPERRVVL
jgi:hypothetical protein